MGNSFWSDPSVEPKRKMRWILNINSIPQWIVKTSGKPSFELREAEHQYINHTFYFPGRVIWAPVSVKLVDPIAPDASRTIMDIIQHAGYHFPEDPNDLSTISKARAVEAMGRVVLSQFGPEGDDIVEEWLLVNAWLKDPKFGELSYDSDDLTELEFDIRYDYAQLITSGPSGF